MAIYVESTDASNSFTTTTNYSLSAGDSFNGTSSEVGLVSDWDVVGINVVAGETYKLTISGTNIYQLNGQISLANDTSTGFSVLNPLSDTVSHTGTPLSYFYSMENNRNEIEVRFTATTTGEWKIGLADLAAGANFSYEIEFSETCVLNFMNGTNSDDNWVGTADADVINLMDGNDSFVAGDCDDSVRGGDGWDTILGGDEDDLLEGLDEHDWLYGQNGNDTLQGGRGDEVLSGGYGNDFIYGENGGDLLYGGYGNDKVAGGVEKDTINGGRGHDRLFGEEGHDLLKGQRGSDYINGGAHNDTLIGGYGNDTLLGGSEQDLLRGGRAQDWLDGGTGDDRLHGGQNSDVFVLRDRTGNDKVLDYVDGVDKIGVESMNNVNWTQVGSHTLVDINGANGQLLLLNVNVNDIDVSDFILI